MKPLITLVASLVFFEGCASVQEGQMSTSHAAAAPQLSACTGPNIEECTAARAANAHHPIALRATPASGSSAEMLAHGSEVARNENAPIIEGRPLTAVVVTQCNLVVAVYMTMPDGRLLRFDQRADVPAQELVSIAYTAESSERVEVACDGLGAKGFEKHGAI